MAQRLSTVKDSLDQDPFDVIGRSKAPHPWVCATNRSATPEPSRAVSSNGT